MESPPPLMVRVINMYTPSGARFQLFSDLAQTFIAALFSHTVILFTSQLDPFQSWLIFMGSITSVPFFRKLKIFNPRRAAARRRTRRAGGGV